MAIDESDEMQECCCISDEEAKEVIKMLNLDEAIRHCEEVAEGEEKLSIDGKWFEGEDWNARARKQCAECAAEHRQLAEWLRELKETKRLLQLAWDDIQTLNDLTADDEGNCLIEDKLESCTECPLYCESDKYCGWRYQVDALMLIGETNEP